MKQEEKRVSIFILSFLSFDQQRIKKEDMCLGVGLFQVNDQNTFSTKKKKKNESKDMQRTSTEILPPLSQLQLGRWDLIFKN